MGWLADGYSEIGDYAAAERLSLSALAIREKLRGPEDVLVGLSLNNLALVYDAMARYDDAEALYLRALAIAKKNHPQHHPDIGMALNNLGDLYHTRGDFAGAEEYYKRSLGVFDAAPAGARRTPGDMSALGQQPVRTRRHFSRPVRLDCCLCAVRCSEGFSNALRPATIGAVQMSEAESKFPTPRQRAFEILEHGRRRDFASRIVDWVLVVLILANVAGTIAQTLPGIEGRTERICSSSIGCACSCSRSST